MVNLWSSDTGGSDVLDLLHIYLISLAVWAFAFLFFFPVLRCVGLGFDWRDAVLTWISNLGWVVRSRPCFDPGHLSFSQDGRFPEIAFHRTHHLCEGVAGEVCYTEAVRSMIGIST